MPWQVLREIDLLVMAFYIVVGVYVGLGLFLAVLAVIAMVFTQPRQ